ncbi:MAG: hypothetical protein WBP80_06710, partial [Planifilum fulgidum]
LRDRGALFASFSASFPANCFFSLSMFVTILMKLVICCQSSEKYPVEGRRSVGEEEIDRWPLALGATGPSTRENG